MSILMANIYCCAVFFLLVNYGESLRCRIGNQQTNDQLHKIMQTCRKKHSGNDNKNNKDYGTMSNENDSDDESASSGSFDEEMFFGNSKRTGGNYSRNIGIYGQSSNGNYGENRRNDRGKQDSQVNRYSSNTPNYAPINDRGNIMSGMNENRNYRNGMQSQNRDSDNDDRRTRVECVTQCFFNELNLVDQRGFPQRGSITEIMTRGVQDPMVRDFISESIAECFRYVDSDTSNREKCAFSKNLMSCFADRGRERCEDWDDL